MKLKLRIDSDDLWMVVVFAIFLLYVVAILVVNLSTFASEGRISGFNPLPAFSKEYIASTLGFYLIAIIAIIASVKSYIFEFDKGFGLTTEKKTKVIQDGQKKKKLLRVKK